FPTLNFPLKKTLHPRLGVYAVWLGTEERFPSVANFGYHPTVGRSDEALLEVHVLNEEPDFGPGDTTHVYFGSFLRTERDFDSVDALKDQIDTDVDDARKQFNQLDKPDVVAPVQTRTV
ncbi:MAG: riboflavin kinase, partial [bacterium]